MKPVWETPEFREVRVNGECTAYSGAGGEGDAVRPRGPSAERPLAFAPAPLRTADETAAAGGSRDE
jgi:hypothetical protein